jgi:hypothetical protein
LKSRNGRLTSDQREIASLLEGIGGHFFCCRTIEEVFNALAGVGVPVRAKLMAGGGFLLSERGK